MQGRSKAKKTKKGLVLYRGGRDKWYVDYPDKEWSGKYKRYGGATTIRVMNLIYFLDKYGWNNIAKADRMAFGK